MVIIRLFSPMLIVDNPYTFTKESCERLRTFPERLMGVSGDDSSTAKLDFHHIPFALLQNC